MRRRALLRSVLFAALAATGAGLWALADEPQPEPTPTAEAAAETAAAAESETAADDAATAAAAVAAEEAAKAAAAGQVVDAAAEEAAEKAGVRVEPEAIVPVGAEPIEVSPPLPAPTPEPVTLPEIIVPPQIQPVPLQPPPARRPRPSRPKVDPLETLADDATATEIEAVLAQAPQTYLVIDVGGGKLEIKARGIVLDQIPIQATHVLYASTVLGQGERPVLSTPTVWKVTETPDDAVRELIAPTELRPYAPEAEREAAATGATTASAAPEPEAKPPASYRISLDRGWNLAVVERLPRRGVVRRFLDSARSGWAAILGRPVAHPPTFALTVDEEDARRIHHLFRVDTAVLLTAARR